MKLRSTREVYWLEACASAAMVIENTTPATVIMEPAMIASSSRAPSASEANSHGQRLPGISPRCASNATSATASTMEASTISAGRNQKLARRLMASLPSVPLEMRRTAPLPGGSTWESRGAAVDTARSVDCGDDAGSGCRRATAQLRERACAPKAIRDQGRSHRPGCGRDLTHGSRRNSVLHSHLRGIQQLRSGKRILQHHRVIAVRAGADDADRAAGQFLQRAQVGTRGGRQLVPDGDAVGILAPTRELEVDRRDLFPALRIERRVFGALAAVLVGDADLELLHAVEHVELGDAQAGDAVDGHGALERDDVDPAAAARAPRRCAVLGAAIADALADLVVELGRERAAAHARGI